MSKRARSDKDEKQTDAAAAVDFDYDEQWDRIDDVFSREYRVRSDAIRSQVTKELETSGQWFNDCPVCGDRGTAAYRGPFSRLQCVRHHQWWPCTNRLIESSDEDGKQSAGCDERRYYGPATLKRMRSRQAAAKAQVLRAQAKALTQLSKGKIPVAMDTWLPAVES